jgi:hypothetical protein
MVTKQAKPSSTVAMKPTGFVFMRNLSLHPQIELDSTPRKGRSTITLFPQSQWLSTAPIPQLQLSIDSYG